MTVYAIGDIQGCYTQLQELIKKIQFNVDKDRLWFTGDLVNRGPDSLKVLRFVKALGKSAVTVLGNHDLHLLAIASGNKRHGIDNTFAEIFAAQDCDELLEWLRHRPLLYSDSELDFTMVHAGLPPQWDVTRAEEMAREVENLIQGHQYLPFFKNMYGNTPAQWSDKLAGWDRLRYITNSLTRIRYCLKNGALDFKNSSAPGTQPPGYYPWFSLKDRVSSASNIVFGHWSSLGYYKDNKVICIDSGCLWGGALVAQALDGNCQKYAVKCPVILDSNDS